MDGRYSEVGMFGAIANAIADLKHEADRIAGTSEMKLSNTLTCGELQHILDYALKATKKLKTIRFTDENVLQTEQGHRVPLGTEAAIFFRERDREPRQLNHFLADSSFVEAVGVVVAIRDEKEPTEQTIEFVNPYSNGRHHEIANVRVTTKDGLLYEPQWTASRGFHCVQ
jgi:hypothetical protein